jgi:hypothetical protein
MGVVSDQELARLLLASHDDVPDDRLGDLAVRVISWLDAMGAGEPFLSVERDAVIRELADLGVVIGSSEPSRQVGASDAETGAVEHDSPLPDPVLVRQLRELYGRGRR